MPLGATEGAEPTVVEKEKKRLRAMLLTLVVVGLLSLLIVVSWRHPGIRPR